VFVANDRTSTSLNSALVRIRKINITVEIKVSRASEPKDRRRESYFQRILNAGDESLQTGPNSG